MKVKRTEIKEFWLHIIAWICFISFPLWFAIAEMDELNSRLFWRIAISVLIFYINYLVLVPYLLLRKKIWPYILISILCLAAANWLLSELFAPRQLVRVEKLLSSEFKGANFGVMKYTFPSIVTFAFFLLGGTIALVKDFYKRDQLIQEKEIQKTETELQFLKNQLNPHFLFNSLNSIYSLVRNKSNEATEAVITLSELMRYMLYEANEEKVALSKEIEYIKNYIALQRLRVANSDLVSLVIKGDLKNKKIHPLLLISFVENAFKYGTNYKGETDITIVIEVIKHKLHFMINNFIGHYNKDQKNSGIGLANIRNRLDLLYPKSHSISIREEENRYFVNLELILDPS